MPPQSNPTTVASGVEPLLTLRFEGRPNAELTKWELSHPNSHSTLGAPRRPIVVERSDLRPLREGKLALLSFLLLGKLWSVLDGGSQRSEFFWEGRARSPANSLYDTLHGSKQGWVDAWFGYAPSGGPDGSTRDVVKRLAGLLITPSKFRNQTARGEVFYQFRSMLTTNTSKYAFHRDAAPYTPLRLSDLIIEWGPGSDDSIVDPEMLLSLALAALAQGDWALNSRENIPRQLGLPDALRRWLEAPQLKKNFSPTTPTPITLPDEKRKVRVDAYQITKIKAETENIRMAVKLHVFDHLKEVSNEEKRELVHALELALGLHEVAGEETGSVLLTILLSRAQAVQLAEAINAGQFDRFGLGAITITAATDVSRNEPKTLYSQYWLCTSTGMPRKSKKTQRAQRTRRETVHSSLDLHATGRALAEYYTHKFNKPIPNDLAEQISKGLATGFYRAPPGRGEEVVQEAVVRFIARTKSLDPPHGVRAYFAQFGSFVAFELISNESRKDRELAPSRTPLSRNLVAPRAGEPISRVIHAESTSLVLEAIDRLSARHRRILLGRIRGAAIEAIAVELRINVKTVRGEYRRAVKVLRSLLVQMGVGLDDFSPVHPSPFFWPPPREVDE